MGLKPFLLALWRKQVRLGRLRTGVAPSSGNTYAKTPRRHEIVTTVTGVRKCGILRILAQCAIAAGFGFLPLPKRGPANLSLMGPELRDNNEPCG